jgi:hypothetical protein
MEEGKREGREGGEGQGEEERERERFERVSVVV